MAFKTFVCVRKNILDNFLTNMLPIKQMRKGKLPSKSKSQFPTNQVLITAAPVILILYECVETSL